MTTLFSAVLSRLGLSQSEAAELLGVRPDTVKSWAAGRRNVPPGVWDELRKHARSIEPVERLIDRASGHASP